MSQINGIDPFGLHNNIKPQSPNQNLENGNPQASWFDMYQWNLYNGDVASQLMYPGIAQYSEFSQQMVAQMYQNWWYSEPERMKRSLDAGINPYVAASGISGASSAPSVSAPNSAAGLGAAGVNAASNAFGTLAQSINQSAQGIAQYSKLRGELRKLDADTENVFVNMGFTKLQSKALSISLKYLDQKEQLGVWQALADFEKTSAEYSNLLASNRNILAEYDNIIAQKELLIAEKGEVEALKLVHEAEQKKIQAETNWINIERQFFLLHGYKLGTPIYESLRDMMVNNKSFDLDKFGTTISEYESGVQGAVENARLSAQSNYVYSIEYARQAGKNAADELFGRIGSPADLAGRIAKMSTDLAKNTVSGIENLFKAPNAKKLRAELNDVLNNCYDQLDKYPEDAERLTPIIEEIKAALTLSNKELLEWQKKSSY